MMSTLINNGSDFIKFIEEWHPSIYARYFKNGYATVTIEKPYHIEITVNVPVEDGLAQELNKILLRSTSHGWNVLVNGPRNVDEPILETAERILRERQGEYGDADRCLSTVAEFWNSYIKSQLPEDLQLELEDFTLLNAHDVAMMMCLLKISRAAGYKKRDNYADIAGYAALAADLVIVTW